MEILENGAKAKDFAILYRTNAQSRLLEQALLRRKLNYQLIGGFRFYQREEVKDILAYLRLIHNPTDDISFDRVVNVPTRGLGDKSLEKVAELAKSREIPMLVALRAATEHDMLSKKAKAGAKEFLAIYDKLLAKSTGPLLGVINCMLEETGYIEYLTNRLLLLLGRLPFGCLAVAHGHGREQKEEGKRHQQRSSREPLAPVGGSFAGGLRIHGRRSPVDC